MNWILRIILRRRVWSVSDCNWTKTQNHLVCKWIFNDLEKIKSICKNLAYMITDERRTLINDSLTFRYCPLVWTSHNNHINNKMNTVHEKVFWIICDDKNSWFRHWLEKDQLMTIHHCKLHLVCYRLPSK